MQSILGTTIFVIVCAGAFFVALSKTSEFEGAGKLIMFPAWWAGGIVSFYVAAAVFAGLLWVVAWVGIYLRYIALWIISVVLHPWNWVF